MSDNHGIVQQEYSSAYRNKDVLQEEQPQYGMTRMYCTDDLQENARRAHKRTDSPMHLLKAKSFGCVWD